MGSEDSNSNPPIPKNRDPVFMRNRQGKARGGRPAKKLNVDPTIFSAGGSSSAGVYTPTAMRSNQESVSINEILLRVVSEPASKRGKPKTKLEAIVRRFVESAMSGNQSAGERVLDQLEGKPGRGGGARMSAPQQTNLDELLAAKLSPEDVTEINSWTDVIVGPQDTAASSPISA